MSVGLFSILGGLHFFSTDWENVEILYLLFLDLKVVT